MTGQEITLKRIFHGDRKLIEYTSGELRAQRRIKAWSVLAAMLDEKILSQLEKRDLGDREYDPFFRKVLALDVGRPSRHDH